MFIDNIMPYIFSETRISVGMSLLGFMDLTVDDKLLKYSTRLQQCETDD